MILFPLVNGLLSVFVTNIFLLVESVFAVPFDVIGCCWIPCTLFICTWRNLVGNDFEQISQILLVACSTEPLLVLLFVPMNVFTEFVNVSGLGITPGSVFDVFISSTTSCGGLPSTDEIDCWFSSILSSAVSEFAIETDDELPTGSGPTPCTFSLCVLRKYLLQTCYKNKEDFCFLLNTNK